MRGLHRPQLLMCPSHMPCLSYIPCISGLCDDCFQKEEICHQWELCLWSQAICGPHLHTLPSLGTALLRVACFESSSPRQLYTRSEVISNPFYATESQEGFPSPTSCLADLFVSSERQVNNRAFSEHHPHSADTLTTDLPIECSLCTRPWNSRCCLGVGMRKRRQSGWLLQRAASLWEDRAE